MCDPPPYEHDVRVGHIFRSPSQPADNLQGRQQQDKPPPCRIAVATDDPVSLPDPPSNDHFSQEALHADIFQHPLQIPPNRQLHQQLDPERSPCIARIVDGRREVNIDRLATAIIHRPFSDVASVEQTLHVEQDVRLSLSCPELGKY